MTWGEHYVYCGVCGCKVYDTEAVRDEERKWVCRKHVLDDLYNRSKRVRKHITPIYPQIRNKPQRVPSFKSEVLTWEKIGDTWETITTNWEDT
jgi:hypothetical protein